jgi:hypothetical protein
MRKIMPPLSRAMSSSMWFAIFAAAVSLGLSAGASPALAQTAPSPSETVVVGSTAGAKDHGGQRASVRARAKGHDQAGVGHAKSAAPSPAAGRGAPFLTEAQIASLKSGLKLTPHQEKYWPAVEAALRRLAFRKTPEGAAVLDSASMQGLYAAAAELVESLDSTQLGEAQRLARMVGLAN